jgi:hypothetical protein
VISSPSGGKGSTIILWQNVNVSYRTSPVKGVIVEDFYFVFPTQAQEYGSVIEGHELAVKI